MTRTARGSLALTLTLIGSFGCGDRTIDGNNDDAATSTSTSTSESGDGDGDSDGSSLGFDSDGTSSGNSGDGDGDSGEGDGDGDGDGESGEGDGDGDGVPPEGCWDDVDCMSGNCFVVPILGGRCGECDEDADCPDGGCTSHSPYGVDVPSCNLGEPGAGCESDAVCQPGLQCVNVFEFWDVIFVDTCSACASDADCGGLDICIATFDIGEWAGSAQCLAPGTLPQDSHCDLEGNGAQACSSGICGPVDVQGTDVIGACGECDDDSDCGGGVCVAGQLDTYFGVLTGSTCN